jgi:hypothetical protein
MLPRALLLDLVEFLVPLMESEQKRHALLYLTFPSEPNLISKIKFGEDAQTFTLALIDELMKYSIVGDQHALLHLLEIASEERGENYKTRSKDLINKFNDWLSNGINKNTKSVPPVSIEEKQKEADLRLLTKLWKYINSRNILDLHDGLEEEVLDCRFLENTVYEYLKLRHRKEFQVFYDLDLNQAFEKFDHLLGQLRSMLLHIYEAKTSIPYVLIPQSQIYADAHNHSDAIYDEKKAYEEAMMQVAKAVFKQHEILIGIIPSNTTFVFPD